MDYDPQIPNYPPQPEQPQQQQPVDQQSYAAPQSQQPVQQAQASYQQPQNNGAYQQIPPASAPSYYSDYQQNSYNQPTYSADPYPPQSSTPGLSIAGMICGILSLLTCCFYYIGLPLAILGLIFSIIGMKRNANGKGMAIAGIVTSAISLAIAIIMLIIVLVAANSSPYFYYEFENWLENLY